MASWLLSLCGWMMIQVHLAQGAALNRGQKFQIILTGRPDTSKTLSPADAEVWDIDMFDNTAATISALKATNKFVICYFSAGTAENWRSDYGQFASSDLGSTMEDWPDEKWVRVTSQGVRDIMANRIKMAADKGCNAIDPDNTDGYSNSNGLNLKDSDAVDYLKWMQQEAAQYGMKIGLKNSLDILDSLSSTVDFAVNEQCAAYNECGDYSDFLALGKPVFHIEYPEPLNAQAASSSVCKATGVQGMSTILKDMDLNGETVYCDGSTSNTPLQNGSPAPEPVPSAKPSSKPSSVAPQPNPSTARPSSSKPGPSTPSAPPSQAPTVKPQPSPSSASPPRPSLSFAVSPRPSPSTPIRPQPSSSARATPVTPGAKPPVTPSSRPCTSSLPAISAPAASPPAPVRTTTPVVKPPILSSVPALPSFSLLASNPSVPQPSAVSTLATSVRPSAVKASSSVAPTTTIKPSGAGGYGYGPWWGYKPWGSPNHGHGTGRPPRRGSAFGHGHGRGRH